MIYLASPYSHPDAAIREQRFRTVCEAAACLSRAGRHVFSPIARTHGIAEHGVPTDWSYWKSFDSHMLAACDELMALMLRSWRECEGVQTEIDLAIEMGIPIRYLGITHATFTADTGRNKHEPADASSRQSGTGKTTYFYFFTRLNS